MRIWQHHAVEVLACFAAFFLCAFLEIRFASGIIDAIRALVKNHFAFSVVTVLLYLVPAASAANLTQRYFRRIPARCAKCGGRALAERNRPVRYRCRDCGHIEITRLSSGGLKGLFYDGD